MRVKNTQGTLNVHNVNGDEIQDNDRYGYKIVAVVYPDGFWSAYVGHTDWSDTKVADNGDKLSYNIARDLFSTLDAVLIWNY